jgi:hypothetical protein
MTKPQAKIVIPNQKALAESSKRTPSTTPLRPYGNLDARKSDTGTNSSAKPKAITTSRPSIGDNDAMPSNDDSHVVHNYQYEKLNNSSDEIGTPNKSSRHNVLSALTNDDEKEFDLEESKLGSSSIDIQQTDLITSHGHASPPSSLKMSRNPTQSNGETSSRSVTKTNSIRNLMKNVPTIFHRKHPSHKQSNHDIEMHSKHESIDIEEKEQGHESKEKEGK